MGEEDSEIYTVSINGVSMVTGVSSTMSWSVVSYKYNDYLTVWTFIDTKIIIGYGGKNETKVFRVSKDSVFNKGQSIDPDYEINSDSNKFINRYIFKLIKNKYPDLFYI